MNSTFTSSRRNLIELILRAYNSQFQQVQILVPIGGMNVERRVIYFQQNIQKQNSRYQLLYYYIIYLFIINAMQTRLFKIIDFLSAIAITFNWYYIISHLYRQYLGEYSIRIFSREQV